MLLHDLGRTCSFATWEFIKAIGTSKHIFPDFCTPEDSSLTLISVNGRTYHMNKQKPSKSWATLMVKGTPPRGSQISIDGADIDSNSVVKKIQYSVLLQQLLNPSMTPANSRKGRPLAPCAKVGRYEVA